MATLHVKFPKWPGWDIEEFHLAASGHDNSLTVAVLPEHSDYSSDSPVFRASIEGTDDDAPRFALKFAMREDLIYGLEEEERVYGNALKTLQGSAIPRCFGIYTGMQEDRPIACLVLEYFGECIKQPFQFLPLDLKIQILEHLGAIHREGLLHGDFAERNVLLQDGNIRIIDFDQTEAGHHCRCTMNFRLLPLPGASGMPGINEFGCEQLWEVWSDLRMWDISAGRFPQWFVPRLSIYRWTLQICKNNLIFLASLSNCFPSFRRISYLRMQI
ncbi:hypothetical protein C8R44DRAFT_289464 [Mycena epipterygia]|nr:hypothetical protein C8R44DRAFT_289464 [Mycena epipterygia]